MSFGRAASRPSGFPSPTVEDPCPCGSGERYGGCCGPLLAGVPAATAEALMRSRYTAFVVGDALYLRASWHPRTRPDELDLDPTLRWTGLAILSTTGGGAPDDRGVVEFRAGWTAAGERGALHERSRFRRWNSRWHYLDGELDPDVEGTSQADTAF